MSDSAPDPSTGLISISGSRGGRVFDVVRSIVPSIFSPKHRRVYSKYFDPEWYIWAHADVTIPNEKRGDPRAAALRHYLTCGWRTGLNPNQYMDVTWYLDQNPDIRKSGLEPLFHYATIGWREGHSPSVYFDSSWYLERNPDVRISGAEPLFHYLRSGWKEGRSPSVYFDVPWYEARRPDVMASGMEPLRHYLMFGWRESCSPSVYFDAQHYMAETQHLDMEPLKDYLTIGWRSGRRPVKDFDPDWYNGQRRNNDTEPLKSYVTKGWRQGFSPSSTFDLKNYIRAHPDSIAGDMEPFRHYLLLKQKNLFHGTILRDQREARSSNVLRRKRAVEAPTQSKYFALSMSPLVSIIIPNYNGARHLHDLFTSIFAQTYENFEIIFVDDGSDDDSIDIAKRFSIKHIVETGGGANFAKANNIALSYCSGELIALLNNDMRVDSNWLEALVGEIKRDPLIAAVAPKIRFWTKFQTLTIRSNRAVRLDVGQLLASLEYKKYFVPSGAHKDGMIVSVNDVDEQILLHVPAQTGSVRIHLKGSQGQVVTVASPSTKQSIVFDDDYVDCDHLFTNVDRIESYYIVNNAGSALDANGHPGDRGFGYIDDGEFNESDDLDLFCGGSVLIRRDALHKRQLFISEMGAYYEDSELSLWLRDQGYRIRFCPSSIVYHKHSATTQEYSLFWLEHTVRNKIIFDYVTSETSDRADVLHRGKLHLNHLVHFAQSSRGATDRDRELAERMPKIVSDLNRIISLIDAEKTPGSSGCRIGVFNSYWNTLGGGEAHALDIAAALSHFGRVELISDRSFDISRIARYFGRDGSAFRKRIVSKLSSDVTSDYDIFVNSCFQDQTPSLARQSFYIVSFPSRDAPKEFLESYYFLANSQYTFEHMRKFWGTMFDGAVLYPSVLTRFFEDSNTRLRNKHRTILSVGRFVSSGHTKCQLEIVEAFRSAMAIRQERSDNWKLVLAGSVNDPEYLSAVRAAGRHQRIEIFQNADSSTIQSLYKEASIYVHASGYGRDLEAEPELFEHFGMVVAEAIVSGCYPIVFDAAGPKEIVESTGVGRTWSTVAELANVLAETMEKFDIGQQDMNEYISVAAQRFSSSRQAEVVRELVMNERDSFLDTERKSPR